MSEAPKAKYVCAIGASAGGLRPLEKFFDGAKPGLGVGYVVIQHLSPDHETMMESLLSRHTAMPVRQAIDGTEIRGDHIYLIPPNAEMSVFGGRLRLRDRPERGLTPRPITIFFQSLASDYADRSIAVVLSGTGSDGAEGVASVHLAGGLTLVQDDSAEFRGMPDRAEATGEVDAALPPEEMPGAIDVFVRTGDRPAAAESAAGLSAEEQIMMLLSADTGVDFTKYKSSTIQRRIQRRVTISRATTIDGYAEVLHRDKAERTALFDDLLIDVSGFFRDAEMYRAIEHDVMPKVIRHALENDTGVRIWSAACATGEEAYSMAMLAMEAAADAGAGNLHIQVFATDVNTNALAKATRGIYDPREVSGLDEARIDRHFQTVGDSFRVNPELRAKVTFTRHNLLTDPPFTRIDLAMCRNFLIYLRSEAQEAALATVISGVRGDGYITLGASEDMGSLSSVVTEIDRQWRIYRKTGTIPLRAKQLLPFQTAAPPRTSVGLARPAVSPDQRLLRAYDAILDGHFVGGILLNEQRELVHTFGIASEWMSPPTGRPTLDIFQLIDDPSLRMAVSGIVRSLRDETDGEATARPVVIETSKGSVSTTLVGQRLNVGTTPYHLLYATPVEPVIDATPISIERLAVADVDQFERLESDLAVARDNLRAAIQEQETSNEELSATNEELIASNEELQSTNEELSSVNEELRTLNDENQRQLVELQELSADLDQLLSETEIGVIFLDEQLHVRRFSERAGQYFRVRDNDIGRPLGDLVTHLDVDDLMDLVKSVRTTRGHLTRRTRLVNSAAESLSLRVATYRLPSDQTGVFVAVSDLSDLVELESQQQRFLRFLNQAPLALFARDVEGRYWYKNRLAEQISGPGLGMTDAEVFPPEHVERIAAEDRRVIEHQTALRVYEGVPIDGETRDFLSVKFPIEGKGVGGASIELDHEGPAGAVSLAQQRFRAVAQANSLAVIIDDGNGIIDLDDRYRRLTGFELDARFRSVHPDDREPTLEALDRRESIIPCRLHLADGSWRHVEFRCVDSDGEEITVVVDNHAAVEVATKLTSELAHLQSQMDRRTSTLESNVSNLAERNADLDSFAHAAAHDLKAPLRAMMAFSELAADAIGEEHEARSFLARIEQSSARMAGMVDSLLQLASAGRDALSIRTCDLEPILQQVRLDLSHEIERTGTVFEIGALDPVLADPTALGVILTNLIGNSIKYRSDKIPRIVVATEASDDHIVLTVSDNGIGFDQTKATEIFEPFRRLHSRDQFEGSGVGLAICRRLTSRLDGEIWATSHPDGGTAVSLQLPAPEQDS